MPIETCSLRHAHWCAAGFMSTDLGLVQANPINYHATTPRGLSTPRSNVAVTEPVPFNLASEKLHEARKAEWERQLDTELEVERAQFSSFRAAPAEVLCKSPYVPRKSSKPLTEISNFQLSTDKRNQQRQEFDAKVAASQREAELHKQRETERKAAMEAEEVKAMRSNQMSFKATPIMDYKGRVSNVVHSEKQLTNPMSPHLHTKARANLGQ